MLPRRLSYGRGDQARITKRCQVDKVCAILEIVYQFGGYLECQTGLTDAARASKSEQASIIPEQQPLYSS